MNIPKRTLLYYPTMIIRNQKWIRQSILYWDEIGSIIPQKFSINGLLHESYDMQILQREGIYKPFRPDNFVEENPGLVDEFIALMQEIDNSPEKYEESWIYESKVYRGLVQRLIDSAVAVRKQDKLHMDRRYVLLYMSLLAKYMANFDEESITSPSTDDVNHLHLAFPTTTENKIRAFSLNLEGILPTPIDNVQVVDILRFKERRKDELIHFRRLVYEHQDTLSRVQDLNAIRDLNARFAENLQIGVVDLCKAFKGDGIQYTLGTLKNIFTIGISTLLNAVAAPLPDPTKITLAVAGFVTAGALSLDEYLLDARNSQNKKLVQNSFSYLYLAQEEGLIARL